MDGFVATPRTGHVKDITGRTFFRLTPIKYAGVAISPKGTSRMAVWLCRCSCDGKEILVRAASLINGNTTSCGCLQRQIATTRHGWSKHPMFKRWCDMIDRCTNPKNPRYHTYGARGIYVCERWLNFENFVADMGEQSSPGYTIHRKDNDGPYCPENCKWSDAKEQANCRTSSLLLMLQNVTKTASLWSPIVGIKAKTIARRKSLGWSDERALTEPLHFVKHTPPSS